MLARSRSFALVFVSTLAACAAGEDGGAASDEIDVTARKVEELFVPISNLETSTTRTAKVAIVKLRGVAEAEEVRRCHQYRIDGREVVVCRDAQIEIVMDARYGDFTRWARVRFASGGAPQFFTCAQVSEQDLFVDAYGSTTGHACTPTAPDAVANELAAAIDADPEIGELPTRSVYLPTLWGKAPPESWAAWSEELAKAAPTGEYVGYGSSRSKPCKVKVTRDAGRTEVAIVSLDEDGAEKRVNARIELDDASVYGATRKDGVAQQVSSATRPASVMIVSAETETTTKEYYARNLRVVRFPEQPESVEAGHSAIFIDGSYCQRLSPAIPAW